MVFSPKLPFENTACHSFMDFRRNPRMVSPKPSSVDKVLFSVYDFRTEDWKVSPR
ncbi:hypothetical protein LINPERPRIM_LOCUS6019, partial [Linum perenne]